MKGSPYTCVICDSGIVIDIPHFHELLRVTSDSRIWPSGGQIGICEYCGAVQKVYDNTFAVDAANIYNEYNLYFQGRGAEQKIFRNGIGKPRSEVLVDFLLQTVDVTTFRSDPSWLDLGCGTGHLLRTIASRQLGLSLFGADISETNRSLIESINGVCGYYANGINGIDRRFDFLSLSHVLEHVPSPVSFLQNVRKHLDPGGYLIIAVPNWKKNPFDLLVADHCLHFSSVELSRVVCKAGFEIISLSEDYVPKELILVAKLSGSAATNGEVQDNSSMPYTNNKVLLEKMIDWLVALVEWAKLNCEMTDVGLFGTALAATWLDSACQSSFAFFSDEDNDRSSSTYLGRPVFSPGNVPKSAKVLVPLPDFIATQVCIRLNSFNGGQFLPPPEVS